MASFGWGRLFGRSGGAVPPQKGSTESTLNTLEKLQEVSERKRCGPINAHGRRIETERSTAPAPTQAMNRTNS